MKGKIAKCSKDAKDVVPGAQIILICSPAQTKVDILKQIKPYLENGAYVGTIFGQGGFDMQARYVLGDDIQKSDLVVVMQEGYGDYPVENVDAVVISSYYLKDETGTGYLPINEVISLTNKQFVVYGSISLT